jgi:hypothetical protein
MKSQAHNGIAPLTHADRHQRFQPLPKPVGSPPYHFGVPSPAGAKTLDFHVIGDTGGIKHPAPQQFVADAMVKEQEGVAFAYHVGDVVYFNGQESEYYGQFYEPYQFYKPEILSIPGNHDGTPFDEASVSLSGWCRYFMNGWGLDALGQDAMRQKPGLPNVYWTLTSAQVTIVGLYTNIVEHGSIDSVQQQWFTHELATAPVDRPLIVAMHHPVYSFDGHHSGSPAMADVLQHAINDSRRVPNLVLAGHVHNYQRITRMIGAYTVPFIVIGNSGYWHLHKVKDAKSGTLDPATGATLIAFDDTHHGYIRFEVSGGGIAGIYNSVDSLTGAVKSEYDLFIAPPGCLQLEGTNKINL